VCVLDSHARKGLAAKHGTRIRSECRLRAIPGLPARKDPESDCVHRGTLALAVLLLDPVGAAAASKLAFDPVSLDFGANAAEIEKKGSVP